MATLYTTCVFKLSPAHSEETKEAAVKLNKITPAFSFIV